MMTPEMRAYIPKQVQASVDQAIQDGAKSIPATELGQFSASPTRALSGAPQADAFSDTLHQFVSDVNAKQVAAGDATKGLMTGNGVSLQQAMIAMEEASVSFQLMVEVRNKLLESYQELMRMQV
jgi:flagellar hook-basal body complex protein FliE